MTAAEQFRKIERIAKNAAEQCEAATAEDLEISTWALEISMISKEVNPTDISSATPS